MKRISILFLCLCLLGCSSIKKEMTIVFNVEDQERIIVKYLVDDKNLIYSNNNQFVIIKNQNQYNGFFINESSVENSVSMFYDLYCEQPSFDEGIIKNKKYFYYEDDKQSVLFIEIDYSNYHIALIGKKNKQMILEIAEQIMIKKENYEY